MKTKTRKLVLSRETLRTLEDGTLRRVAGGSHFSCSYCCDSDNDCSSACLVPTNVFHAC